MADHAGFDAALPGADPFAVLHDVAGTIADHVEAVIEPLPEGLRKRRLDQCAAGRGRQQKFSHPCSLQLR